MTRTRLSMARSLYTASMLAFMACGGSTVTDAPKINSIELTPSTATVRTGATVPITVLLRDASGKPIGGVNVFWSSSDTSIAVVSSSGVVSGRAAGTATVAASALGVSASATITVLNRDVANVQVTPAAASIRVGATSPFEARTFDAQGALLPGRAIVWTTSSSSIATVDQQGIVTGRAVGTATITATSEGKSGAAVATVTSIPVATVALSPTLDTVGVGETSQLTATTRDAGGATLTGRPIVFTAADSRIAAVSSSGLVTAIAPGSTVISAVSEGRTGTATIVVRLRAVASVSLTPNASTVIVGDRLQLSARTSDASGNTLTGRAVAWTSSNAAVAAIDALGLVTAVAPGTATITATSEGKSGTASVVVNVVPVASVQVAPPAATIFTGATVQLTATARSSAGTVLTGRTTMWRSGAPSIATVSANGVVTGISAGAAVIIADVEGVTGSATVTVRVPPVAVVAVTPAAATISPAGSVQLTATARDDAGNTLTNRSITWVSSDESIAFVTSGGLVIAFRSGMVTITATSEGISGTARVTVR